MAGLGLITKPEHQVGGGGGYYIGVEGLNREWGGAS